MATKFWQRQNRRINYLLIIDHSCSEQLQPNIPAFPSLTDGPHPRLKLSAEATAALIYWQRIDLSDQIKHKVAHLNWRVESMDLLFVLLKPKGNHETHETTVIALFPSYFVSSFPGNQNLGT